jgi:hypothetical protein
MPAIAAAHPFPTTVNLQHRRRRPRRRCTRLGALALATVLALLSALAPASAGPAPGAARSVAEWHRLNPDQSNSAPQHERFTCVERRVWRCFYDHVAEPTLDADDNVARFVGHTVTSRWECPEWFADHCDEVVEVIRGKARVTLEDGTTFKLREEFIVTESDGQDVLWVHIVDFGVAIPWFRTFDQAVLAAGFDPPYEFDGTNWPASDGIITIP